MDILDVAKSFALKAKKTDYQQYDLPSHLPENPVTVESEGQKKTLLSITETQKAISLNPNSWKQEEQDLINWFLSTITLPTAPFQLKQGIRIVDPEKFYSWLRTDITQGNSARTKWGALQSDLRHLKQYVESGGNR